MLLRSNLASAYISTAERCNRDQVNAANFKIYGVIYEKDFWRPCSELFIN